MIGPLLLTSFTTWKPEQTSNSSDDLLMAIAGDRPNNHNRHYLRQIPVDFDLAPQRVIHHVRQHHPRAIICCGMGESRTTLDLESTAVHDEIRLHPHLDLVWLAHGLQVTQISDDAGRFVCNRLYFSVLKYLNQHHLDVPCIFVHVPPLTPQNQFSILRDFHMIIERIEQVAAQTYPPLAQV